ERGPKMTVIKQGEHGALLVNRDAVFKVPAYPLQEVFDPTGAGDAFAGGFMAYLAASDDVTPPNLRRAMVYGAALGSFAVEAFGGMVRVPPGYERPVLVLSTDGVGTKLLVAARAGIHDTVGEDLVNHCVNDILVHGARPLAFLDYLATAELEPETAAAIVAGVARGCRAHDMILAGGETAQLPDLYQPGHYDLAGTILGVVE